MNGSAIFIMNGTFDTLPTPYGTDLLQAVEQARALGIWPEGDFDLLRRVYAEAENQPDLVQRIAALKDDLRQDQIALLIAVAAHHGQKRFSGGPYIQHPLRIAFSFAEHEVNHRAVALLHDVVEDCTNKGWDMAALAACGINATNLYSVECLTEKPEEANKQEHLYYARVMQDRVAVNVKIQDMTDNRRIQEWAQLGFLTETGEIPPLSQNATTDGVARLMKGADAQAKRASYALKIAYLEAYRAQRGWTPADMRTGYDA